MDTDKNKGRLLQGVSADYLATTIAPIATEYAVFGTDTGTRRNDATLANHIGMALNPNIDRMPLAGEGEITLHTEATKVATIDKIIASIHEVTRREGERETPSITTLPVFIRAGVHTAQTALFRLNLASGDERYIDNAGYVYDSYKHWQNANKLGYADILVAQNGHLSTDAEGYAQLDAFSNARPGNSILPTVDAATMVFGTVGGVASLVSGGSLMPPVVMLGTALYSATRGGLAFMELAELQQDLNPVTNPKARNALLTTLSSAMGASAHVSRLASHALPANASLRQMATILNVSETALDSASFTENVIQYAHHFEQMSAQQQWQRAARLVYSGVMTARGAVFAQKDLKGTPANAAGGRSEQGDSYTRENLDRALALMRGELATAHETKAEANSSNNQRHFFRPHSEDMPANNIKPIHRPDSNTASEKIPVATGGSPAKPSTLGVDNTHPNSGIRAGSESGGDTKERHPSGGEGAEGRTGNRKTSGNEVDVKDDGAAKDRGDPAMSADDAVSGWQVLPGDHNTVDQPSKTSQPDFLMFSTARFEPADNYGNLKVVWNAGMIDRNNNTLATGSSLQRDIYYDPDSEGPPILAAHDIVDHLGTASAVNLNTKDGKYRTNGVVDEMINTSHTLAISLWERKNGVSDGSTLATENTIKIIRRSADSATFIDNEKLDFVAAPQKLLKNSDGELHAWRMSGAVTVTEDSKGQPSVTTLKKIEPHLLNAIAQVYEKNPEFARVMSETRMAMVNLLSEALMAKPGGTLPTTSIYIKPEHSKLIIEAYRNGLQNALPELENTQADRIIRERIALYEQLLGSAGKP